MERKGLRKKDILRMDGLLPPTRRLPVCDAVSSASDKKKDRKWSLGGILRRISSIKDYDSSSNDEEIVYCKKTPRKPTTRFRQLKDGVVLHSIENNSEHVGGRRTRVEGNVRHATTMDSHQRDSLHSRSSDGSLDGLAGKRSRRNNKLKARAEAKRDHLCAGSSSDEDDCRRSNGSLNRFQSGVADGAQNGHQRSSNLCSRRTRAARTERYIKRLSRDEGNGSGDALNDPQVAHGGRCSWDHRNEDKERAVHAADHSPNGLCRPPLHPRRSTASGTSGRAFPVQRSSAECLRGDPDFPQQPEVPGDVRRYSTGQYITDLNQNNTYGKNSRHFSDDVCAVDNGQSRVVGNFFTYPAKNACHHAVEQFDRRLIDHPDNQPPVPPPRDPRYRAFGYSSYPINRPHQNVPNYLKQEDNRTVHVAGGATRPGDWRNPRSGIEERHGSSNEIAWRDTNVGREFGNSTPNPKTEFYSSLERINNKYNSSHHCASELPAYGETTRRRNVRDDDQLNRNGDAGHRVYRDAKNKSAHICETDKQQHEAISSRASDWSSGRSGEQRALRAVTPSTYDKGSQQREDNSRGVTPSEETLERRRSSKNLEEALSELEAIYNSLRLGDEDLLDRAERRSMEEFTRKRARNELDAATTATSPDSPDRMKDDMAYRRMNPKERPTSLLDVAGQSTLSSISYLIASPVLSRRDSADELVRLPPPPSSAVYPRDEPDVTRDDVVYRSISHANNTLRIVDPQPPFGIPLGPVTAATESDYLHTTPTRTEQPRSPYIPQCEPDVVTDDLAYRALRKDAVGRSAAVDEARSPRKEQPEEVVTAGGIGKKRAVRSLSANLYGLINHDRIHLRREPSLDTVRDEIRDVTRTLAVRPQYLRRVVSDGELSDNDAHRWKDELAIKGDMDINGNHPAAGAYRKKPTCTYVSPETTTTMSPARESPKKERESDAVLSSKAVLSDNFWHEYLHPTDSDVSAARNDGRDTDTDGFAAYTRLCQDLVNLIKGDDDDANADGPVIAAADNKCDLGVELLGVDEPPLPSPPPPPAPPPASVERTRSLSSHSGRDSEKTASPTAGSTSSSRSSSDSTPAAPSYDYYLRVADENVKLIAEAFSNVADRLRDSRLSTRKSSSVSRSSEVEDQSGSAHSSSTPYSSQDKEPTRRLEGTVPSVVAPTRDSTTSSNHPEEDDASSADADLSRAVRDLQLAAASLYEHEREIEALSTRRGRLIRGAKPDVNTAVPPGVAPVTSADEREDDLAIRKIGLIADGLRQEERERDQEETMVLPSGIVMEARGGGSARSGGSREGLQALARLQ
ncbi:uncharacterized protein LOC105836297 [Monomorium pharaonis]|uniref:uncharacterized protein LOC105836297 n=1 Tax=Monomorium pharaonis TaxID=307658 RepID=UPI0017469302|nr:uncharacterized protein LOC105836297 [Monomorium pharaonis]